MDYSQDDVEEIKQRCRTARRIYIATVLFTPAGFAAVAYGFLATPNYPALYFAAGAILLGIIVFVQLFVWRCPACRFPFPQGRLPKHCYRCEASLQ